MPVLQDFVARVKNTFIHIAIPRRSESFSLDDRDEEPRRATYPRRLQSWLPSDPSPNVKNEPTDECRPRMDSQGTTRANSLRSTSPSGTVDESAQLTARFWYGKVWKLSRQREGCRRLQAALNEMTTDEEKMTLVVEMRGHIHEASRCPQANYVLQKIIAIMKPSDLHFVVDEITDKGVRGVNNVARHKYGCRIIQRLLEHCTASQVDQIAEYLLADPGCLETCQNSYGTYVMQHLYQRGTAAHRRRLVSLLVQNCSLARDTNLCTVIGKVLSTGESCDRLLLAQSLQQVPGLLSAMDGTNKCGQFTARLARQILAA